MRGAFVGWLKSCRITVWASAIIVPGMDWVSGDAYFQQYGVSTGLSVIAIASFFHLIAYLVTGLPIFLLLFGKDHSLIWKWPVGLVLGTGIGAAVSTLVGQNAAAIGMGACYGLLTAGAALLTKKLLA